MLDRIVGLASVVPFVIGSVAGPPGPAATVDLTFRDTAIIESSGLVVRDGLFLTVNDSGDSGRVFVVDGSGATVGTTSWPSEPTDVEAVAPGPTGTVWVGDIGDNRAERGSVRVLRVPYGRGDRAVDPTPYTLTYPDGPHDAEALLAEPRTGRLFIASKSIFGGTLYAVPRDLSASGPNRLRPVADVMPIVTDGAFFPDGRHYVLRGYGSASVYTYPGHELVATFPLPDQQQGEGIAVAPDGSVHISSEGQRSQVLRVRLPAPVKRAVEPPDPAERSARAAPPAAPTSPAEEAPRWPWLLAGGVAVAGFAALIARLLARHGAAS
jgi:DNA-binding beta-propeller fold protein YncE